MIGVIMKCAAIAFVATAMGAAESPPERYKSLETAIPEGIRLLEAKEYATFLKNFVEPEHFKLLTQSVPLEKFAQKFGEGKAELMLEVLRSIRGTNPTMDASGTLATYTLKEPPKVRPTIVWVKVEDRWYIRN